MRAAVFHESVPPIVGRKLPLAGAGEVRVRVVLSGLNQDGAGVVDALGEGVRDLEPGDRVWLWAAETTQEYVVLPRHQAVRMYDYVPFEAGAVLGLPALKAHRCLTRAADVPDRLTPGALTGRTVLIADEAGAVGKAAIQLAKWAGATVEKDATGVHLDTADLDLTPEETANAVAAVAEAVNAGAFRRP
jgi:NADPH2:quinone reductase